MRTLLRLTILLSAILFIPSILRAQPPTREKRQKPPPDEFKAIINVIEDAYKAPFEVDKEILDELRKQYRDPKPDRENKIFREIRRLYATTAEQEDAILTELRRAYVNPSAQQLERLFHVIRRNGQLPLGSISQQTQMEVAGKLFRKIDRNENGTVDSEEMTDTLHGQQSDWDRNRDGTISPDEYLAYYRANLGSVYKRVASGEIPIKLPKELSSVYRPRTPPTSPIESPRPMEKEKQPVEPQPELPSWFIEFDLNGDGQVALYEWKKVGRRLSDYLTMDKNADGFLEANELAKYLAASAPMKGDGKSNR